MHPKVPDVFELLKKCAADMRTVTYQEIASEVGLATQGVGPPLTYIRDEVCRKRGLPWLTAIAVSKPTRRPATGFLPEGVILRQDDESFWRGMVLQVFAYDWASVHLDPVG